MSNKHKWVGKGLKRNENYNWYYIISNWRFENNCRHAKHTEKKIKLQLE